MTTLEQAQSDFALVLKRERSAAQRYSSCTKPFGKRGRLLLDIAIRAAADREVALAKLRVAQQQQQH